MLVASPRGARPASFSHDPGAPDLARVILSAAIIFFVGSQTCHPSDRTVVRDFPSDAFAWLFLQAFSLTAFGATAWLICNPRRPDGTRARCPVDGKYAARRTFSRLWLNIHLVLLLVWQRRSGEYQKQARSAHHHATTAEIPAQEVSIFDLPGLFRITGGNAIRKVLSGHRHRARAQVIWINGGR